MRGPSLTERSWIALGDGRRLAYSAAGARRGFPVIYLHGAIGAPMRREPALEAVIERAGIRYLVVDRPGFGESDPDPDGSVASFAGDLEQLADALGLDRLSVVGVSAGGPYALACAWAMPERISTAAAVSSVLPGLPPHAASGTWLRYRYPLKALAHAPGICTSVVNRVLATVHRRPGLIARFLATGATDGDDASLADAAVLEAAVRRVQTAIERGAGPSIRDYVAVSRPWGFETADIHGRVQVWHGGLDRLVAVRHAVDLAEELPNGSAAIDPRGGHFFFRHRLPEILGPLAAAQRGPSVAFPVAGARELRAA
jgi:pimeloyl-ACP methyl ester carboxylesterase